MVDHTTTHSLVTTDADQVTDVATDAETIAISDAAAADARAGMDAALAAVDALDDSSTVAAAGIDAALAAVATTPTDVAKALAAMKPAPAQYSVMSRLYTMSSHSHSKFPCPSCETMVILGEKCCGHYRFP